jgi:hypothetical protein
VGISIGEGVDIWVGTRVAGIGRRKGVGGGLAGKGTGGIEGCIVGALEEPLEGRHVPWESRERKGGVRKREGELIN